MSEISEPLPIPDTYYITFPQTDKYLWNKYQMIHARSWSAARRAANAEWESGWAFIYTAEEFKEQPEKYGLQPLLPCLWDHSNIS